MRYLRETLLSGANAAVNQTSAAVDCSYVIAASLQVVSTGTAAGTVKLQASNDAPGPGSPSNFTDIPSASVAVAGAGSYLIPKLDISYQYIRAVYTFTSGTGTITLNLKSIGF